MNALIKALPGCVVAHTVGGSRVLVEVGSGVVSTVNIHAVFAGEILLRMKRESSLCFRVPAAAQTQNFRNLWNEFLNW